MTYKDLFENTTYSEAEELNLLNGFLNDVKVKTKGRVDFGQVPDNYSLISVPYFHNDKFGKEYFQSFLKTDKTDFNKISEELYKSPDKEIMQKYIYATMLIKDFFVGYEFETDEVASELTLPSQRKRRFLGFIGDIKIQSEGKITLPLPTYLEDGLNENEIYYGFTDSNTAAELFNLYLCVLVTRKEDERYKLADFETRYNKLLGIVISNPSSFIRDDFINEAVSQRNSNQKYWYKETARGNNL